MGRVEEYLEERDAVKLLTLARSTRRGDFVRPGDGGVE